jgi:hypothetical protein
MAWRHRSVRLLGLAILLFGCGSGSTAKPGDGGAGASPQGTAGGGGSTGAGGATGGAGAAGGTTGSGGHAGSGASTTLPACPGEAAPTGQTCRTIADCPNPSYSCDSSRPNYPCGGGGGPPLMLCSGDAGCMPDQICVPMAGPCYSGVSGGTTCIARCTSTSCETGMSCDTASGLCKPTPCGTAFMCATATICAPSRQGADVHGCAPARCDTDGYTCPDGFTCAPGPGASTNGCAPVSCVGGAFKCPVNTDCKAGSTGYHNCETRKCTADKSCDCGACIGGYCQNHLFVCSPPAPS